MTEDHHFSGHWNCHINVTLYSTTCYLTGLTGSTTVRVGSDLRQLYAIGELDDYELLKKEISESHSILNGMECRIRDRMRSYSQRSQGEVRVLSVCVCPLIAPVTILCLYGS